MDKLVHALNPYLVEIIVTLFGGVFTYLFGRYVKPWLDKTIDTEYEKEAYYKARKVAIIASDMVKSQAANGTKLGLNLVDELLEQLIKATDVKEEVAKRVLEAAVHEEIGKKKTK